ncbi:DUF6-domain-containing protein [Peniophora sp. CONT]|nr:DUF6-domain-containing protein [Peniophora sp. CONT]
MAARAGYTALTPETTVFPPRYIPAPVSEAIQPLAFTKSSNYFTSATSSAGDALHRYWDKFRGFVDNNAGLLLVALAQLFFAFVNVSVKVLKEIDVPMPTLELVLVRMSITYICCLIFMYWQKVPDPFLGPKGVRLLLVFRGFIGQVFFGLFGVYFSLRYLSLSDATVLTFLAPIFTGIASAIVLKEPFSRKELLAGLCSFVGVILIARPQFLFGNAAHPAPPSADDATALAPPAELGSPHERLIAVGVALLGVVGATGAYTSIRAIGKRAHPLHSLAFFSSQSCVVAGIGMAVTHTEIVIPKRLDFLALFGVIGVGGFLAQVLLTMGLQREAAGRATLAVYVGIIFALALEKIFFNVSPSALSVTGTAIILSCALYIALTKENTKTKRPAPLSSEDSALEQGLLSPDADADELELRPMDNDKSPRLETEKLPEAEDISRRA